MKLKIILRQEIDGLGKVGEVKNVKDGYARNYLIPNGLALEANDHNLKIIENEKRIIIEKVMKEQGEAKTYADKLSQVSVTIPVESKEDDKIFGSVGAGDISAALKQEGYEIDKKNIILENPIKEIGAFNVEIKVHRDVSAKIKVWVVKKEGVNPG